MHNTETRKSRPILKLLLVLAVVVGISVTAWLLDRQSLGIELSTYLFSYGFYANALPIALVFLLLLLATNRIVLSTLLTVGPLLAIYFANTEKMRELLQPIVLSDLYFLRSINRSVLHLLGNYMTTSTLAVALVGMLVVLALCIFEPRYVEGRRQYRVVAFLALAFIGSGLLRASPWATNLYSPQKLRIVPWSPGETELHAGLFGSLAYAVIDSKKVLSQPVDYAGIDKFVAMVSERAPVRPRVPSVGELPDIIVIQSESFFDPVTLNDIQSTDDLLPNLHRAEALGYGGTMKVPTFGGGTLRTEFEVLTGIPMAAIPELKFPYLQLHSKVLPSIVQVAHDNGYRAFAVHPNDPSFWNRENSFRAMGFDAFYSEKSFPANVKKDGLYISDEAMTNKIINILDSASKPTFLMAISIEAHGPYGSNPVSDEVMRKKIPVPSSWPQPAVNEYQTYAYHIHHADRQLGRLWNYLEARNKPFVLIFYGDHLPGLPEVYRTAGGFKNHLEATEQKVPWLLITDKRAPVAQPKDIHSWMLGGQALCAADITAPDYYALLNRADTELNNPDTSGREGTILGGVNALSILRLRGIQLPKNAISAAAHSGCFAAKGGPANAAAL